MRTSTITILAVAFAGCAPDARDGILTGIITDGPTEQSNPISSARVRTFDAADSKRGETTSANDGTFDIAVPWAGGFFVQLNHNDAVPTSFSAVAVSGAVEGGPGDLWLKTQNDIDALRADFEGCATALDEGGIIEGEVKVYLPVKQLDDLPRINTATVTVTDPNGLTYDACYLADRGRSDPDATITGDSGRFAVFGLPAGISTVHVVYFIDGSGSGDTGEARENLLDGGTLPVRLEDGGVSPLYPFWVVPPV